MHFFIEYFSIKILQKLQYKVNLNIIVFFVQFSSFLFKIFEETITFFNYFILTQFYTKRIHSKSCNKL